MTSKRASNRAIGSRAETQFKDILHAWGFLDEQIEKARPTYKMIGPGRILSSQNDIYSLYDFMVKHKGFTMYVQVKAGATARNHVSTAKGRIMKFIDKYGMETDMHIIAEKIDRRGFILHHIYEKGEFKREYITFKGVSTDEEWTMKNGIYDKDLCKVE